MIKFVDGNISFLDCKLSEWQSHSTEEFPIPNWFRVGAPWENYLGSTGYDVFIGLIQVFGKTEHDVFWHFDCILCGKYIDISSGKLIKLWESKWGERFFSKDELPFAKQEIDKFIVQFNKLKCFI